MTVNDTKPCVKFDPNGTSDYQFSFQFSNKTVIKVSKTGVDGTETPLNNPADFDVINEIPDLSNNRGFTGGTVRLTTNLLTGEKLSIVRMNSISQPMDLDSLSAVDPSFTEEMFDHGIKIDQELDCRLDTLETGLSFFPKVPDPNNAPDGKMIITNNNHYVFADRRTPDPSGEPDNKVLVTDNGSLVYQQKDSANSLLPPQASHAGEFLQTDGVANISWQKVDALPAQTGNDGKVLTTDGTTASWAESLPTQTGNAGKVLKTDGTDPNWADCYCPPDPSGEADGRILETKSGALQYVDVASATNPFPPFTGNAGSSLIVNTGETGVEYKKIDGLPDQTGNADKHLTTDGSTASWTPELVPSAAGLADGQHLVAKSGAWTPETGMVLNDDQQIEDSSGVLTGYTLTNSTTGITVSDFTARFLVGGKRVEKTFTTQLLTKPSSDALYFLVAKSDGTITYETLRPQIDDGGVITLGTIRIVGGVISDYETSATNLKGNPDQIKFLSGLIGGKIFNGFLTKGSDTTFAINSIVKGEIGIWRYGVNSSDLGQYNFAKWTFDNPSFPALDDINHKIMNKDGITSTPKFNVDFSDIDYYDNEGNPQKLGNNKRTIALVFILPDKQNVIYTTYGYGEYDNNNSVPSIQSLVDSKRALLPIELVLYGNVIGGIEYVRGKNLGDKDGSFVIAHGGTTSGALSGGASTGAVRSFDVSDGLLGTCEVTIKASKTSLDVQFGAGTVGVFCDDVTNTVSRITPIGGEVDVTTISTGEFSYLYLQANGALIATQTLNDTPRGNILLAVIDHTDRTAISHVYEVYTSSDVDAHRIHDIWKAYRPTVRGCVPSVNTVTDNTDPANPITTNELHITAGTFYNYTADPSKKFDNYFVDIAEKTGATPFYFRSIQPKDYAESWDKDNLTTPFTGFPDDPKLIDKLGVETDLTDGNVTFYPVYLSSKGKVILGIPEIQVPIDTVFSQNADDFLKEYENKIDITLFRDYARIGAVYVKNENGIVTWGGASSISDLKSKFLQVNGQELKFPTYKYGSSILEHKGGVIQEYDPLSYTLGIFGDMENYPSTYIKDLTHGYWDSPIDDDIADGSKNLLGMHDLFDTFPSRYTSSPPAGTFYTADDKYFTVPPKNNISKPILFNFVPFKNNIYVQGKFRPNKACNVDITVKTSFNGGTTNINRYEFLVGSLSNGMTTADIVTTGVVPPNAYQLPYIDGGFGFRGDLRNSDLSDSPLTDPFNFVSKISNVRWDLTQDYILRMQIYKYGSPATTGVDNFTASIELNAYDAVAPKDHIRMKFGTLASLNTAGTGTPLSIQGDRPSALTVGDVVVYLQIDKKSGVNVTPYLWNCDLKHEVLVNLMPRVILIDPSGTEKPAELAQIISWHQVRYTLRNVTQIELDTSTVVVRIFGTNTIADLNLYNISIGACMFNDAF